MIVWHWRSFDELTVHELYAILALRQDVFNVEQICSEPDIDHRDKQAQHLLGLQNNQLVAYLRLFEPDSVYPGAMSIGRVVTAQSARGQGIGKEAMQQAMLHIEKSGNTAPIVISAQIYLTQFYESFGFRTEGEPYDEAGIIHIKMRKLSTLR